MFFCGQDYEIKHNQQLFLLSVCKIRLLNSMSRRNDCARHWHSILLITVAMEVNLSLESFDWKYTYCGITLTRYKILDLLRQH